MVELKFRFYAKNTYMYAVLQFHYMVKRDTRILCSQIRVHARDSGYGFKWRNKIEDTAKSFKFRTYHFKQHFEGHQIKVSFSKQ